MSRITRPGILCFALRFAPFVLGLQMALAAPATVHARQSAPAPSSTVAVRVEGEAKTAASMLDRLRKRGARRGITVIDAATAPAAQDGGAGRALRILVLARGPKWHQVLGVAASGAVTVLDGNGNLLFMHLRQKEATAGIAMDEMADEILERLPALLRGEPQR